MKLQKRMLLLTLVTSTLVIGGCGSSNNTANPEPEVMVEVEGQTGFRLFIDEQFAATANNTDPIDVNNVDLSFVDQDDQNAFDTLLAP